MKYKIAHVEKNLDHVNVRFNFKQNFSLSLLENQARIIGIRD